MESKDLDTYLENLARDERYRVDEVLGTNALETTERVFLAVGDKGGTEQGPFVRKRINTELGLGTAYELVFCAQQAGACLPELPRVFELLREPGLLTVVMEWVEGQTLAERVAACANADERLALARELFPRICDAVSILHEALGETVVHRDLKPSNIMVCEDGVKLLDLGIARVYKPGAQSDTRHFGTRPYAPPEQYGFGQTDARSDVYALGMVLFFCLTGRDPEPGDRAAALASAGLPEQLAAVIERATRFDPDERPNTAHDLRDEFDLAAREAVGAPVPPAARVARPATPHPTPARRSFHTPEWLGALWDVLVAAALVIIAAACVLAVVDPTPENSAYPTWYLLASFFLWMLPGCAAVCLMLLDPRPVRRLFPKIPPELIKKRFRWGIAAMLASSVLWVLLTIVAAM